MFLDYATMPGFTVKVRVGLSGISSGLLHSLCFLFFWSWAVGVGVGDLKKPQKTGSNIPTHLQRQKKNSQEHPCYKREAFPNLKYTLHGFLPPTM